MIENKTVIIPVTEELTSKYIEDFFKRNGLNVLRWAIVDSKAGNYIVNVSVIE